VSIRIRLALLIALTVATALGAVFVATYQGTANEVRSQIDQDLRQDAVTFDLQGVPPDASKPKEVERAARDYVESQPFFGALARLYVVRVIRGPIVTNDSELLGLSPASEGKKLGVRERRRRRATARALRTAKLGYTTLRARRVGELRLLVKPLVREGRRVALVEIGEPLSAVDRARAGVRRAFFVAGSIALALAVLAAWLIASRVSKPLRRMARTAAEVDAGDLSHRIGARGPRDEVRVLADAFDRMLDRLADAFARQRGFVADASHELRTPLTVIRGQLEVLARQPDVSIADVARVDGVVRTEIVRMERLVEDLLLLARSDENRFVRLEAIEVDLFVEELWDGLSLTAHRDFRLGPLPGGTLAADGDRVAQVVANLVRNAVEHTGRDGLIRLTVTRRGGSLEWAVEDDGPGIPSEYRERVFDRFHRTEDDRSRETGGTGLGLAIARAIVESHGGEIWVGVSPEGGARVAFVLPRYVPVPARRSRPGMVSRPRSQRF
jgi:signal transduction histidine kinase